MSPIRQNMPEKYKEGFDEEEEGGIQPGISRICLKIIRKDWMTMRRGAYSLVSAKYA